MNKLLNIIVLLSFIIFTSCTDNEKKTSSQQKVKPILCLKPSDVSRITMSDDETTNLEILLDKEYPIKVNVLNVMDAQLFLGKISKLWSYKGNYYITDMDISKKIYSFDKNGKIRFVINNNGEGPGQYKMLWDVQFNPHYERIEIWDITLHKLLFFDLEGKFISEQKVNLPIMSFFPVTKDWYAYHIDGRDNMGKKTPLLQLSDITGNQIINKGAWEYGIVDAAFTKQEYSYYDRSPYFLRPMMDTIYWIGPVHGHICPTYVLDFKGKNIPEEAKKEEDLMKAGNMIQKAASSFTSGELVVGRTFMSFEWQSISKNQKYITFADRFHEDKAYQIKEKDLQLFGIQPEKMLSIENLHNFIAYAFPHKVNKEALAKAIANEKLPRTTRSELAKIQQLSDQEMPFLITFRLKHIESDGKE